MSIWDDIELSTLTERIPCQFSLTFFSTTAVVPPYTVTVEIYNDFPNLNTANPAQCDIAGTPGLTLLGSGTSAPVTATGVQVVNIPIVMTGVLPDARLNGTVPPGCGATAIPGDQFPNDDFFFKISCNIAGPGPIIASAATDPTIGCNDTAVGICGTANNGLFIGFTGGIPGRFVTTIRANHGAVTTGRCCDSAGNCTDTLPAACIAPSVFAGVGSSCTGPGFNGQPCVGRCCATDGSCTVTTAANCPAPGLFGGLGTDCTGTPCQGKCCEPTGFCVTESPTACTAAGGVFSGLGTACDPQTPDECLGRCCLPDGSCLADGPNPCVASGGTFGGIGVACGDNSACLGRCCQGTTCTANQSPNQCAASGGTITLGQACDSFTVNTFDLSAAPLAIPDGLAGGGFGANATDIRTVSGVTGNISDLNVDIKINHTWVGDLVVDITHLGTTVTVIDLMGHVTTDCGGCGNPNIDVILDDEGTGGAIETQCNAAPPAAGSPPSFTPNNPLSAFDGMNPNGTWTITARDGCAADTGSLLRWSLHFLNGTSTACAPSCACKGDMNGSGTVNGADINKFAQCVVTPGGAGCACADINGGGITVADVTPFVNFLITGTGNCVP